MTRGMTHFNDGKYKRAARDFRRHLKFSGDDLYRMMWLSLAVDRQGGNGRAELGEYAAASDRQSWPRPLVDMYLGQKSPEAVLASLENDRSRGANERRCEAYFFIAQWHSAKGDEATARQYFQKTVDTEVRGFMEYASAKLALNRTR